MSTQLKVVMFIDQIDSTATNARQTHKEIEITAREQDRTTTETVNEYGGKILRKNGDGVLAEFDSCANAVRCGAAVQQKVRARNAGQAYDLLKFDFHIGIDFGEVLVLPDGDLRGDAANIAFRVCSMCPSGEVYFTEKVMNEIPERLFKVSLVGAPDLKGVDEKINIYRLVEILDKTEFKPSPFLWPRHIIKPEDFFGRIEEQKELRECLHKHMSCQIVGSQHSGKTSLLLQIENLIRSRKSSDVFVYLNMQDNRCHTLSGWLKLFSKQLKHAQTLTALTDFTELVEDMQADQNRLVLCMDEFDEVTLRGDEFTREFFLALRARAQEGTGIFTASLKPLSALGLPHDERTSPFYSAFRVIKLGAFPNNEAKDFIASYRPESRSFTKEEQEGIREFSRGHPLVLQIACEHVLHAKKIGQGVLYGLQQAAEYVKMYLSSW